MQRTAKPYRIIILIVILACGVAVSAAASGARKSSTTGAFVNDTGQPVHGLQVKLSSSAIVVTDATGRAGPFGDISGNDTSSVKFSNPAEPVEPSDEIELTFKSYKKSLNITVWWWVGEDGKRVGDKNKVK